MSDVSPLSGISGLSFDSTLFSPLLFFCLVLLLFLSYLFSACWPILLNDFENTLQHFSLKDILLLLLFVCLFVFVCVCLCLFFVFVFWGVGGSWVLCCFLFVFLFLSIPVLYFFYFFESSIDESTEWSTIPVCPSLMCVCNRGKTEGTNSSKICV